MKGELPLQAIADVIGSSNLPPVETWHPQHERSVDISIHRNGDWYYQESRIERPRMVRLFSSVLRVDDGKTYLVTPHEKLQIHVEDAPFTAVSLLVSNVSGQTCLEMTTNVGDTVTAGPENPVFMATQHAGAEPKPYIRVRGALNALILRPVYYQLAELAELRNGSYGVESNNHFMVLAADESDV